MISIAGIRGSPSTGRWGSFHPVDSDQLSFEICAIQAFKSAAEKASPALMEPIMKMEVVTPEESMGDVISDLNKRHMQ